MRLVLCLTLTVTTIAAAHADEVRQPSSNLRPPTPILRRQKIVQTSATVSQTEKSRLTAPDRPLLEKKSAELATPQAEVDRLSEAAGQRSQVRLTVRMVEIKTAQLRKERLPHPLELDTPAEPLTVPGLPGSPIGYRRFENEAVLLRSLAPLVSKKCATNLSKTILTTRHGQGLTFMSTGESSLLPTPAGSENTVSLSNNSSSLEISIDSTQPSEREIEIQLGAKIVGKGPTLEVSGVRFPTYEIKSCVPVPLRVKSGETLVLRGQYEPTDKAKERPMRDDAALLYRGSSDSLENEILWLITCDVLPPSANPVR